MTCDTGLYVSDKPEGWCCVGLDDVFRGLGREKGLI